MTDRSAPTSPLIAHLLRGAIGFGLTGATFALIPNIGAPALLLLAPGVLALRGCPTCWVLGLLQTISAGRLTSACTSDGCELRRTSAIAPTPSTRGAVARSRPRVPML